MSASTGRVLVTGSTGFIGRAFCSALSRARLERLGTSRELGFDLERPEVLDKLPPAEIVVHLAGRVGVQESWSRPADTYRTNLLTTLHALEFARRHRARVVVLGSYLYGVPRAPLIDETHPLDCASPYARSKRQAELLCEAYAADFDVPVVVLRLFNVFGPDQPTSALVPRIIEQACAGPTIQVADLVPRRDFLWIDDLVEALLAVVRSPFDGFSLFNLGSGVSHSVQEVIDAVMAITGPRQVICTGERRTNEIPDCVCDARRFRCAFDWRPRTTLADGIRRLVARAR